MRRWNISAFFPEVKPAHMAHQACTVEASSIVSASRRGMAELLNVEGVKGKRIGIAKITIVACGKEKKECSNAQDAAGN